MRSASAAASTRPTRVRKGRHEFPELLAPKIDEYEALLTTNRIWLERTKNVGVISRRMRLRWA